MARRVRIATLRSRSEKVELPALGEDDHADFDELLCPGDAATEADFEEEQQAGRACMAAEGCDVWIDGWQGCRARTPKMTVKAERLLRCVLVLIYFGKHGAQRCWFLP